MVSAQQSFWELLSAPLPAVGVPTLPAKPEESAPAPIDSGGLRGRYARARAFDTEANKFIMANRRLNARWLVLGGHGDGGIPLVQTAAAPVDEITSRDRAVVFLALIAAEAQNGVELMATAQAKFEAWHWPIAEQMLAFRIIHSIVAGGGVRNGNLARGGPVYDLTDQLLRLIETKVLNQAPDRELDEFCYQNLPSGWSFQDLRLRIADLRARLGQRLAQIPSYRIQSRVDVVRADRDTSPEGAARRKSAALDIVAMASADNPEELCRAITLCAEVEEWGGLRKVLDELKRVPWENYRNNSAVRAQLSSLALNTGSQFLSSATVGRMVTPDIPRVMLWAIYGRTGPEPPRAPTVGTGFSFDPEVFPPPSRYVGSGDVKTYQLWHKQWQERGLMPTMYEALNANEQDLGGWRQVYPATLRVYFMWWENRRGEAIVSPVGLNTASKDRVKCSHPEEDWRS